MAERQVSYDSHRPLLSKGVTLIDEPNVTHYATMTPENTAKYIMNIPMPLADGLFVPVPTVRLREKLPLEPIYYEVRDEVDFLITDYGNIPIGGIEQRSFKTMGGKNAHLHLIVSANVGPDEQEIMKERIFSLPQGERVAEVQRIIAMLPKVSFHQDKGLLFKIADVPLLTLTLNGPVINREMEDEDSKLSYNFCEYEKNQKLLPYEDGFSFEFAVNQTEDSVIDYDGNERTIFMIAGVRFPRSVDFAYINTYIKTYIENGGKLTDSLIREELMDPYLDIFLKDTEREYE